MIPNRKCHSPQDGTLKGRDILCFSHDWSGDPLSKTHIMRLLAKENRILWVNSIGYRKPTVSKADFTRAFKKLSAAAQPLKVVENNIFVLNPLAIPAYGRPLIQRFNRSFLSWQVRRAMRRLRFTRPINWVFNPAAAIVAGTLNEEQVIYHCVDEYSAFTGVDATALQDLEQQLLRKASLVIVSADRLFSSRAAINSQTVVVKHGVDFSHFRRALDPATTSPADVSGLPKPILGFFGLVADWVDIDLLAATARRFPTCSLVIVGKITTDVSALRDLPNVHLLGQKPYSELPGYCKAFDVALMPFTINELTLNANPLKVREYLAAGLPVVSTQIPEVAAIGLCSIAADVDSFEREIRAALRDPGPSETRSDAIAHESWEQRVHEIQDHFRSVAEKACAAPNPTNRIESTA